MKKIGLLAGVGRLPVECAKAAAALGYEVYAVGLIPGVDPELKECTADYTEISVAKLQTIIDYMKAKEVTLPCWARLLRSFCTVGIMLHQICGCWL